MKEKTVDEEGQGASDEGESGLSFVILMESKSHDDQ